MRARHTEEAIIQNLEDAGCCQETIECFMTDYRDKKTADKLKLLAEHRRKLVENQHKEQKCIDCLDYLVYDIEKTDDI